MVLFLGVLGNEFDVAFFAVFQAGLGLGELDTGFFKFVEKSVMHWGEVLRGHFIIIGLFLVFDNSFRSRPFRQTLPFIPCRISNLLVSLIKYTRRRCDHFKAFDSFLRDLQLILMVEVLEVTLASHSDIHVDHYALWL